MLDKLHDALKILPTLLAEPAELWESLDIDYHPPRMEQLWWPWKGATHRIHLHRIHRCEGQAAYRHTHPWPAAMKVLEGSYMMPLFYGAGSHPDHEIAKVVLPAGAEYEMCHPDSWHATIPLTPVTLSVMVTGPVWTQDESLWEGKWRGEPIPPPPNKGPLDKMTEPMKADLLEAFRRHFGVQEKPNRA